MHNVVRKRPQDVIKGNDEVVTRHKFNKEKVKTIVKSKGKKFKSKKK